MRTRHGLNATRISRQRRFFADRSSSPKASAFFSSDTDKRSAIQSKLKVGAPNDRFEQEADSIADRVVQRMEGGSVDEVEPQTEVESEGESVQTKCRECEEREKPRRQVEEPEQDFQLETESSESEEPEEDVLRAKSNHTSGASDKDAGQAASAVSTGGRVMTADERATYEPAFGKDFSRVRIHESAAAGAAARNINAKAYTLGSDIAFAPGEYLSGSKAGLHLMAHELTHVVQQGQADTVRRAPPKPTPLPSTIPSAGPSGFKIGRVPPSSQSRITFARDDKRLTASATRAVAGIKKAKPASVKLLGFVSMDENPSLAEERAKVVKTALEMSPNAVTVSSAKGNPTSMASSSKFGTARSVEVVEPGKAASTLDCKAVDPVTGAKKHPPTQPCPAMDPDTWTAFNAAWVVAREAMKNAVDAVKKSRVNPTGKPSVATTALIDRFFGNHNNSTLGTLRHNLSRLKSHVDRLDRITSCGGQCDIGGCSGGGTIAYNNDVDASSRMTLCVPVFKNMNTNDQARNLIHESAHGTTPLGGPTNPATGTRDVAYRHERMMFSLKPEDRLRNSDSYALFAMFLREGLKTGSSAAKPAGIATPGAMLASGFNTTEEPALMLAIAKLEKRLAWARSWIGQLFGEATNVKNKKYAWSRTWAKDLMKQASARFPLTAPPAEPTRTDLIRIAGIRERYGRMSVGVKQPIGITKKATGVVDWPAGSGFFAGTQIKLGPDFFKASADDRISLLLQALAAATKDVETRFIPAYSSLAKWIHGQNP